jgi:hypothetical protein
VAAQRIAPTFVGGGPRWGPGGFGPGPAFIERDGIINNRRGGSGWLPGLAIGGGLFGLGMLAGNALAPRPVPAPVVAPQPVYVAPAAPPVVVTTPPPVVVQQPAPVVVQSTPAEGAVPPQVAAAPQRLSSSHDHSRRDGALTLGQLGDERAVTALIDRLQRDNSKEVRIASAWALAEIGDPRAAVDLKRAAMFDKRREVRQAAVEAYNRLPREGQAPTPGAGTSPPPAAPVEPAPPPPPEPAPIPLNGPSPGFRDSL